MFFDECFKELHTFFMISCQAVIQDLKVVFECCSRKWWAKALHGFVNNFIFINRGPKKCFFEDLFKRQKVLFSMSCKLSEDKGQICGLIPGCCQIDYCKCTLLDLP